MTLENALNLQKAQKKPASGNSNSYAHLKQSHHFKKCLQGAIAALSGEGLHKDFSPTTCDQMLSIFEAASKSPEISSVPGKLRFVIKALASNLETLMRCMGTSGSRMTPEVWPQPCFSLQAWQGVIPSNLNQDRTQAEMKL